MFFISISNGLLTPEHREKIGSAIWEFMWLIDKITKIDDDGRGYVLGGKPIKLEEVAMGQHYNTVSTNLARLKDQNYIETIRTPYGMSIVVLKAKKRFTKNSDSQKIVGESQFSGGDSQKTVNTKKTIQRQYNDNIYKEIEKNEWLDKTKMTEWIDYRKEIKKPLTVSTVKRQIAFLKKFQKDHIAIIEQSITNGWRGLFPIKQNLTTDVIDKAKAFDKQMQKKQDEKERAENLKHNDELRKINEQLKDVGKMPWKS